MPASIQMRAAAERLAVLLLARHPHRVPREPALPDVGLQLAGREVEREVDAPVIVRRVARSHRVAVDENACRSSSRRGPRAEVLPERSYEPLVLVAQRARRTGELARVAGLEERVTRVRREPAAQVGP